LRFDFILSKIADVNKLRLCQIIKNPIQAWNKPSIKPFLQTRKNVKKGRDELRTLRKNDPLASDFFTADSLETEFCEKGDIEAARKAIEIFERLLRRGGFDFLKARIEQLKRNAGLSQ